MNHVLPRADGAGPKHDVSKAFPRLIRRGQHLMLAAPDQPGESLRNVVFRPGTVRAREHVVHRQAMELLEVFDLARLADDYAGTLSGGQRKLLELARALMTAPRLLLLDEPMAGINPTLGRRLLDHMQRLRSEQGVSF